MTGLLAWLAASLAAQAAWREEFEGPQITWQQAGGDATYRIEAHERTNQTFHGGATAEYVSVLAAAGQGTSILLSHPIGRAPVIRELEPSVWVMADRPGIQLSARVVFPRSRHPATGQPITATIAGAGYTRVGNWQQMRIDGMVAAMQQQALVLRAETRLPIDAREAYVDQLLLNVYAGPGRTRVWIDDLEVQGVVSAAPDLPQPSGSAATSSAAPGNNANPPAATVEAGATRGVALSGTSLLIDGRAVLPRAVDYNGEPLAALVRMGFNAVRLSEPPTATLLEEARRARIWLICPPPAMVSQKSDPQSGAQPLGPTATRLGPEYAPVIAWDVGENLTSAELQQVRTLAEQIRAADPQRRPIVCHTEDELRDFSRHVDVLCTRMLPLGTTFQLADFGVWVRERGRLARPGTPYWTTIQTQPAPQLEEQVHLLAAGNAGASAVQPEQIRLLTYEAVSAGARGLLFESRSPLTAGDAHTRARAAMLELLNAELELIEPWTAVGGSLGQIPAAVNPATGAAPGVRGALLRAERGVLLLPVWSGPDAQNVPGQLAAAGVNFTVPGVPDPNEVYEITAGGLRPLRHQRMAGGLSLTIDEFSLTSMVVLTQDGLLINGMTRRLQQTGRRMAELERLLAQHSVERAAEIHNALGPALMNPALEGPAQQRLAEAQGSLRAADMHLAGGDLTSAHLQCRRAVRTASVVSRDDWQRAANMQGGALGNPTAALLWSLPQFSLVERGLRGVQHWRGILPEADFEDMQRMLDAGWRHYQHVQEGVQSSADLSLETRHNPLAPAGQPQPPSSGDSGREVERLPGQRCLRLVARAVDERAAAGLVETPPLWITSPAVHVEAGQLVQISGWVYVPEPINGSLDGLLVLDSIGGEPLARRFGPTSGWQQFTSYRMAPRSGTMSVTIALTGFGEAWIDDLSVSVPTARRTEQLPLPPPQAHGPAPLRR